MTVFQSAAQHRPHVRLAAFLAQLIGRFLRRDRIPKLRHRLADRLEGASGVRAGLDHAIPPELRVIESRCGRQQRERVVSDMRGDRSSGRFTGGLFVAATTASAVSADPSSVPSCSRSLVSVADAGKSQKRTGTPRRVAQVSACHSGENTANGQNAAVRGSSTT